ncbi:hypothetical protein [Corticicoccus populi]|uniref:Uncharacterized protein n=1 Tax=Corticicoccus populi TaxID=1812821 RepID=A0ABW5WYC1_9STAP
MKKTSKIIVSSAVAVIVGAAAVITVMIVMGLNMTADYEPDADSDWSKENLSNEEEPEGEEEAE